MSLRVIFCHLIASHLLANGSDNALFSPSGGMLWVVILAALASISVIAAAFGYWAMRRLRTQRARAEELAENIRRIRDDLDRRRDFLNAISHDLRTPLNGITLQTHVVERAIAQHDMMALTTAAREMRQASGLAAEILEALLQCARVDIDQNRIAEVKLREVLLEAADPFRAAAREKSLVFDFDVPDELTLATDRTKLARIVANLLDNAVKFTPQGSVTLRARGANPGRSGVIVEVTDTGPGISRDDQRKMFREFFQANNPSRDARLGLGLGLVVAQRLAQRLGGRIACQSKLHGGTAFQVTLPVNVPNPC